MTTLCCALSTVALEAAGGQVVMKLMFWGRRSMPLARGKIVGYDSDRLAFTFVMMNADEAVECRISDAAMDQLIGAKGTESLARQALFVTHRDRIEQIASDLYDAKQPVKGAVIRIFTKHV
jgi:hypothetical protein